ncbi:MAG: heat-shock protein Hsp20 [Ignavibacteriales bacterium CG18_big_fil_WC_8_21_14_2_50_31_20]|nr:MAG: heat-shock protein Hsp20 [Ignavibacteriales bacterium CG18_big_fil_WC_8_21_14_2_50_31_20]
MTLVSIKPMKEFDNIHNSIQKYFDDFTTMKSSYNENTFSPKINVYEKENQLIIDAEVPGVNKEDLKITLQDNILTIEGEKKNLLDENEIKSFLTERIFGSFKRSFTINKDVDSEKINAKFNNGILSITLAKVEEKTPTEKVIEVR